jgi:hypothetical protein
MLTAEMAGVEAERGRNSKAGLAATVADLDVGTAGVGSTMAAVSWSCGVASEGALGGIAAGGWVVDSAGGVVGGGFVVGAMTSVAVGGRGVVLVGKGWGCAAWGARASRSQYGRRRMWAWPRRSRGSR